MTFDCLFGNLWAMNALMEYMDRSGERPSTLARRLGVEPSTVTRILNGERKPSVELAKRIENLTGISRAELRPDIFGDAA